MAKYQRLALTLSISLAGLTLQSTAHAATHATVTQFSPGKDLPQAISSQQPLTAGQRFSTQNKQVQEIIFPDGTVIVLAENSAITIRNNAEGDPVIYLDKGTIKVASSMRKDSKPLTVAIDDREITIDAATVVVQSDASGVITTSLVFGKSVTVNDARGSALSLIRPGFSVTTDKTNGVQSPNKMSREQLTQLSLQTRSKQLTGFSEQQIIALQQTDNEPSEAAEEKAEQVLALVTENAGEPDFSNEPLPVVEPEPEPVTEPTPEPPPTPVPEPEPDPGIDIPSRPESLTGINSDGFGPGGSIDAPDTSGDQPSQTNSEMRGLTQNRTVPDPEFGSVITDSEAPIEEFSRAYGRTTNILYSSDSPFTVNLNNQNPAYLPDTSTSTPGTPISYQLAYAFYGSGIVLESLERLATRPFDRSGLLDPRTPLFIPDIRSALGSENAGDITSFNFVNVHSNSSSFGSGTVIPYAAQIRVMQTGFSEIETGSAFITNVVREPDNFIIMDVRPLRIELENLRETYTVGELSGATAEAFHTSIGSPLQSFDSSNADDIAALLLIANVILNDDTLDEFSMAQELQFLRFDIQSLGNDLLNADAEAVADLLFQAETEPDPSRPEQYLFATGNVDGRLPANGWTGPNFSVDTFFLSAGLNNYDQRFDPDKNIADGIRAFARNETTLGLSLMDSGLLIVNPASEGGDEQTGLLHVDFAISGSQGAQQSTLSATIGHIDYVIDLCMSCDITESIDTLVDARTIGSSQGDIVFIDSDTSSSNSTGTIGFASSLRSTAAGGGNPDLNRAGYAGYLVLQNFDPEDPNNPGVTINGDSPLDGGAEIPVGNAAQTQNYAYLRLATATGTDVVGARNNSALTGWATALATTDDNNTVTVSQLDTDLSPNNFSLTTAEASNRIAASLTFYDIDGNNLRTPLALGGLTGEASKGASAFIDNDRYGARSLNSDTTSDVALISSELVASALPDKEGLAGAPDAPIDSYQYLQWGFFFGDTMIDSATREHVHMGTWVAGAAPDPSDLPTTGSATYTGHAIGNVFNGSAQYTAVGSYSNSWDFATRRGTVDMQFDSATYTGQTQLRNNDVVFDGRLDAAGREGALHGNFVQGGGDPAAGVVGRFSIANTPGSGDTYRAAGTFAAEK